jgi:hypothetical protein
LFGKFASLGEISFEVPYKYWDGDFCLCNIEMLGREFLHNAPKEGDLKKFERLDVVRRVAALG